MDANTVATVVSAAATVAVAVTTIVYAIFTRQLVRENQLLRKASREPSVVVYLLPDSEVIFIMNFVVANIGQGPARKISMRITADEDDLKKHNVHLFKEWGKKPISILPQGEKIVAALGGLELFAEPALKPFKVELRYEDISGTEYNSEHSLDPSEFLGLIRIESPQVEAAHAVKKAADALVSVISRSRLNVEVITAQEQETRDKAIRDEWERRRSEKKS